LVPYGAPQIASASTDINVFDECGQQLPQQVRGRDRQLLLQGLRRIDTDRVVIA
jgi:hypothetical protein